MFASVGVLHYEINDSLTPPYKCVLQIDQGISDFYFATIPRYVRARKQAYGAHISVVRKELPTKLDAWGKYEGREVAFEYENWVRNDERYYWLDAFSLGLEDIRTDLGLENKVYIRPMPENSPYKKRFHFTIGNIKAST